MVRNLDKSILMMVVEQPVNKSPKETIYKHEI